MHNSLEDISIVIVTYKGDDLEKNMNGFNVANHAKAHDIIV